MRKLIKLLYLCGFLAIASPAFSQIHLNVNIGPPLPRPEVVVTAPSASVTWVPGYYVFEAGQYVWVPGHYQQPPHRNYVWVAPRYERRGNHIDYYEGRWGNPGRHLGQIK